MTLAVGSRPPSARAVRYLLRSTAGWSKRLVTRAGLFRIEFNLILLSELKRAGFFSMPTYLSSESHQPRGRVDLDEYPQSVDSLS